MSQADSALTLNLPSVASAVPASYAVHHSGWIPVIDHPDRAPAFVREERFPRKVKATPQEAVDYASRVIHYRRIRDAAKQRHLEILQGNLLRQTKLSPDEAMTIAERVWRTNRQLAETRRKVEALSHPRYAYLEAAE